MVAAPNLKSKKETLIAFINKNIQLHNEVDFILSILTQ
jgi:hypothetical protein